MQRKFFVATTVALVIGGASVVVAGTRSTEVASTEDLVISTQAKPASESLWATSGVRPEPAPAPAAAQLWDRPWPSPADPLMLGAQRWQAQHEALMGLPEPERARMVATARDLSASANSFGDRVALAAVIESELAHLDPETSFAHDASSRAGLISLRTASAAQARLLLDLHGVTSLEEVAALGVGERRSLSDPQTFEWLAARFVEAKAEQEASQGMSEAEFYADPENLRVVELFEQVRPYAANFPFGEEFSAWRFEVEVLAKAADGPCPACSDYERAQRLEAAARLHALSTLLVSFPPLGC